MVNKDSTSTPGFTLYRGDRVRLLLPIATAAEIEAQAEADAAELTAAAEKAAAATQKAKLTPVIPPKKSFLSLDRGMSKFFPNPPWNPYGRKSIRWRVLRCVQVSGCIRA